MAMYASHFSIRNIPFGIASSKDHRHQSAATRIEDTVVFLDELAKNGLLSSLPASAIEAFSQPVLNNFAALPKSVHRQTRAILQTLLDKDIGFLPATSTVAIQDATMHLPMSSCDFTDFSCSKDHVLNAGEAIMKKRFLPPGFLYFPVGYTARTSSVVVSGTPIVRPKGQFRDTLGKVVYEPTKQMDYELEVACIIGKPSQLTRPVQISDADEHMFGLVLLNDWSARDIQGLEMIPLGPLNGKSFATSISPWIITLEALQPSAAAGPSRELEVATYLSDPNPINTYDLHLQADLIVNEKETVICKSDLKTMYWSFRDLIAHQTSNGSNINTGDILATGTISGHTDDSHGCLLELTNGGQDSFQISEGSNRLYLEDGDILRLTAVASDGVGFGECIGRVMPSLS